MTMRRSARNAALLRTEDRIILHRQRTTAASCGGLLGCCIPIAGLILFLVWKDTKPRTAKAAGIGALVCVIAYVLMYVAAAALGISAAVYAY